MTNNRDDGGPVRRIRPPTPRQIGAAIEVLNRLCAQEDIEPSDRVHLEDALRVLREKRDEADDHADAMLAEKAKRNK